MSQPLLPSLILSHSHSTMCCCLCPPDHLVIPPCHWHDFLSPLFVGLCPIPPLLPLFVFRWSSPSIGWLSPFSEARPRPLSAAEEVSGWTGSGFPLSCSADPPGGAGGDQTELLSCVICVGIIKPASSIADNSLTSRRRLAVIKRCSQRATGNHG